MCLGAEAQQNRDLVRKPPRFVCTSCRPLAECFPRPHAFTWLLLLWPLRRVPTSQIALQTLGDWDGYWGLPCSAPPTGSDPGHLPHQPRPTSGPLAAPTAPALVTDKDEERIESQTTFVIANPMLPGTPVRPQPRRQCQHFHRSASMCVYLDSHACRLKFGCSAA